MLSPDIKESDWKVLRQLEPIVLERFCNRVLSEVAHLASETGRNSHERYFELHKLIRRTDREFTDTFSDLRRSTALMQLAIMQSQKLLTSDELARFSEEAREAIRRLTTC